jgi:uncharacterized protein
MKIEGSYHIPLARELVWQKLMDPGTLARVLPGCEKLEATGPNSYDVVLKVGIAAVKGTYQGHVEITDPVPPQSCHMKVEGKGSGGFLKSDARLTLAESPEGTTVSYSGDIQVGGLIAAIGQRLQQAAARQILTQFFQSFAKHAQSAPS